MEKVVLSKGYEFELVVNAVSTGNDTVSITFYPGEDTIETLETKWAGNELIKIVSGEEAIRNFSGYTNVKSIAKIKDYVVGGIDEEGNDVTADVCTVTCAKADLTTRVSDAEDAIENLINTVIG